MDLHLEEGERGREMGRGGEGEREDKGRGGGEEEKEGGSVGGEQREVRLLT